MGGNYTCVVGLPLAPAVKTLAGFEIDPYY